MNSWIRTRNSWIWISTRIFEFQLVTRNSWLVFYHITVDVNDVVLVFLLLACFTPFSIASTLDFEQVNVSWVVSVILFIFHIFLFQGFSKIMKKCFVSSCFVFYLLGKNVLAFECQEYNGKDIVTLPSAILFPWKYILLNIPRDKNSCTMKLG